MIIDKNSTKRLILSEISVLIGLSLMFHWYLFEMVRMSFFPVIEFVQ